MWTKKKYFVSTLIEIFKYNFVLFFGYEIIDYGKMMVCPGTLDTLAPRSAYNNRLM